MFFTVTGEGQSIQKRRYWFSESFAVVGSAELYRATNNVEYLNNARETFDTLLKVKKGTINIEDISEETVSNNLYTSHMPDPDLLIRTSGELRLSNFLMWQLAYAEFLFVDKNWPEFTTEDLDMAIEEYQRRNRKTRKRKGKSFSRKRENR